MWPLLGFAFGAVSTIGAHATTQRITLENTGADPSFTGGRQGERVVTPTLWNENVSTIYDKNGDGPVPESVTESTSSAALSIAQNDVLMVQAPSFKAAANGIYVRVENYEGFPQWRLQSESGAACANNHSISIYRASNGPATGAWLIGCPPQGLMVISFPANTDVFVDPTSETLRWLYLGANELLTEDDLRSRGFFGNLDHSFRIYRPDTVSYSGDRTAATQDRKNSNNQFTSPPQVKEANRRDDMLDFAKLSSLSPANFAAALHLEAGESHPFITLPYLFSPEECRKIISMGTSSTSNKSTSNTSSRLQRAGVTDKGELHNGRISSTLRITNESDWDWVSKRIVQAIVKVNTAFYGFELEAAESLQFTKYDGDIGGHYDWHMDIGMSTLKLYICDAKLSYSFNCCCDTIELPSSSLPPRSRIGHGLIGTRKLSISVQLSLEESYQGGALEFQFKPQISKAAKNIGTGIVFPSYMLHRVAPVETGIRYALVQWFHGSQAYR